MSNTEEKMSILQKIWARHVSWSNKHEGLSDFIAMYLTIMLLQIVISMMSPSLPFVYVVGIVVPIALLFSSVRAHYLDKEARQVLSNLITDEIVKEVTEAQLKIKDAEKENKKVEAGETCVAVCRECDVRVYTGDELYKSKQGYSACSIPCLNGIERDR